MLHTSKTILSIPIPDKSDILFAKDIRKIHFQVNEITESGEEKEKAEVLETFLKIAVIQDYLKNKDKCYLKKFKYSPLEMAVENLVTFDKSDDNYTSKMFFNLRVFLQVVEKPLLPIECYLLTQEEEQFSVQYENCRKKLNSLHLAAKKLCENENVASYAEALKAKKPFDLANFLTGLTDKEQNLISKFQVNIQQQTELKHQWDDCHAMKKYVAKELYACKKKLKDIENIERQKVKHEFPHQKRRDSSKGSSLPPSKSATAPLALTDRTNKNPSPILTI